MLSIVWLVISKTNFNENLFGAFAFTNDVLIKIKGFINLNS